MKDQPLRRRTAMTVGALMFAGALALAGGQLAGAVTGFQVTASPSLNARGGPGTGYGIVGSLASGAQLDISCQVQGGTDVNGNSTWDQLSNGWWIADYWTSTPSFNSYIPGVSDCNASTPTPTPAPAPAPGSGYATTASPTLTARSGPGTGYGIVGSLGKGSPITVSCQVQGGTNVNGNKTWDQISNGWFISDYWTTTPSFNSFIPGVPNCGSQPAPAAVGGREAAAMSRARSMLGQRTQSNGTPWSGWCDRFVAVAFGRTSSGFPTAYTHYQYLAGRGAVHAGDTIVPPGTLAFFGRSAANGNAGHVMLSIGNGQFISTTSTVIHAESLSWGAAYSHGSYLGWSYAVNW